MGFIGLMDIIADLATLADLAILAEWYTGQLKLGSQPVPRQPVKRIITICHKTPSLSTSPLYTPSILYNLSLPLPPICVVFIGWIGSIGQIGSNDFLLFIPSSLLYNLPLPRIWIYSIGWIGSSNNKIVSIGLICYFGRFISIGRIGFWLNWLILIGSTR